jgi:branched-chain amino acid aminotransferase
VTSLSFEFEANPNPVDAGDRARMLENPGFGKLFTDHMAMVRWSDDKGWHDAKVIARGPLLLDPATAVLHYAQEIFEGLKAYRLDDGAMALFRPRENARRFRESAQRLAMPQLPDELFVGSIEALIAADRCICARSCSRARCSWG